MKYFPWVSLFSALLVLVGCGGGGSDGSGVPEPGSPSPGAPAVMRLRGNFSIQNDYSLIGKPSSPGAKAAYSNKFAAEGSVEQLVTVAVDAASGDLIFSPVGTDPMKVTATVSEVGHCETASPDDATVVASLGDSRFSGTLSSPVEYSLGASAIGLGDEFSLRMAAFATGTATLAFTAPNGSVQSTAQTCPGLPSILERNASAAPDTAKLARTQFWSIFPALGQRPPAAADQPLFDAIAQKPSSFHLGLVTSTARDRWTYSGTKVFANTDTQFETVRWTETVVLDWRLETP